MIDIGRKIALVAKRVYQSTRSNEDAHTRAKMPWEKLVHSIFPDNFLQVPEVASFGPIGPLRDIADAEIILVDSTSLNGMDFIIFCTGYRFSSPFLPIYRGETVNFETITNGVQLHNLHKDIFFIDDPTLTFIGVLYETSAFAFFDIQAVAIAAAFSAYAKLPSKQQIREEYDQKKQERG